MIWADRIYLEQFWWNLLDLAVHVLSISYLNWNTHIGGEGINSYGSKINEHDVGRCFIPPKWIIGWEMNIQRAYLLHNIAKKELLGWEFFWSPEKLGSFLRFTAQTNFISFLAKLVFLDLSFFSLCLYWSCKRWILLKKYDPHHKWFKKRLWCLEQVFVTAQRWEFCSSPSLPTWTMY